MSERKLVSKLVEVMKQVKYIEKRGYNKFHRYKYATESDVSERIREVLAEQNVMMMPDVVDHQVREHLNRNQQVEYISTVKIKYTFIDGDTGEEIAVHGIGEGQDAGDKAVYKAITGATKYALMKTFMIPTGDDPEEECVPEEPIQQVNKGVLEAKWTQIGGAKEKFEPWYKQQIANKQTNNSIDIFLTKKLVDKK